jgi:hypothetical protein
VAAFPHLRLIFPTEERRRFANTVDRMIGEMNASQGEATNSECVGPEIRAAQRQAIRSSLVEQGLL